MEATPATKEDLYKAYFCTNCLYYYKSLLLYVDKNKVSFNFWAAIFPVYWMGYRKLYKEAALSYLILWGIQIALYFSLYDFTESDKQLYNLKIQFIGLFIQWFPMGYICNYLYLRKAIRIVEATELSETATQRLRTTGDVNIIGVFIYLIIGLIMTILNQTYS